MSVESGTIYSDWQGPSYAQYRIQYDWTMLSKSTTGWTIRVSPTFRGSGSDSRIYMWGHTCNIKINGVSGSVYKQVTISANGSDAMGSVDISVPLNATGSLSFSATCVLQITWASGTMTASGSLEVPLPYSKCSAPTSLTFASTLIKANSTTTLSWEGASSGISNNISGYNIYRSTSSSGTYSYYKNISTTATSGSTSVAASSTQGSYYYFKIITVGQQSGYNSEYSSASSGLLANTPPSVPTYTYSNSKNTGTVIPYSGGTITVKVSAGSSNNSGQGTWVEYSTNNSNWSRYYSALSTTSAITWYFRTYDGIDYSGTKSFSVTQNSCPTISCTATATDSPSSSSSMSKICNLSFSSLSSGDVVRIYLKRGTSSTSPSGGYEFLSSFTASGSTYSLNSYDIVSKLSGSFFGQYYKLYVTATDAYDNSGYKEVYLKNKISGNKEDTFYFGSLPTFTSINRVGSGTNGYFHDALTIEYTGNIFSSMELRYTSGSSSSSTSYLSSISNSSTSASFSGKSSLFTQGVTYNFYIKATLGSQTVYIGAKSLTKASTFSFSNLSKTSGDCYVIEDEGGKKDIYQEISFATNISDANCLSAFSSSPDSSNNNLTLRAIYGSNSINIPFIHNISGSTLTLKCKNQDLYSFLLNGEGSNPFGFSIHDRKTVDLQLTVTNSFNMISYSSKKSLVIDLTYKPKLIPNYSIKLNVTKKPDDSTAFSSNNQYINEGNKIKIQFPPVQAYTGETITAKSYIGEYTSINGSVTYQSSPFSTHTFGGYPGTGSVILQEPTSAFTVPIITSPKRYKIKTVYSNIKNQSVELISTIILNCNQYTIVTGEISSLVANYDDSYNLENVSVHFKLSSLGGNGYSSFENNNISLIQGLNKIEVNSKSTNGISSTAEYSNDGTPGNTLSDLTETEKTIIITPSNDEIENGSFSVEFYVKSFINEDQETYLNYYTPIKEGAFSKLNIFISSGPAFSIRKGGVCVNTTLNPDEAFSVGPGKESKTKVNFHGLSSINVIIDCGTW